MKDCFVRSALIFALLLVFVSGCSLPGRGAAAGDSRRAAPAEERAETPTTPTPAPPAGPRPLLEAAPAQTAPQKPTAPPSGEKPRSLLDEYVDGHQVIAETEHFVFHANGEGYFPVDRRWWIEQSEVVYGYVAARLGVAGKSKVQVAFLPPEQRACPVRGLAARETPPVVILYADETAAPEYLLAVLAHELGHAIPGESFPGGLPTDPALTEGLATWAAGKYWLDWKNAPSFDGLVRGYIADGLYEPLTESFDMQGIYPWQEDLGPSGDCLARRDRVYSSWGAFLGYLIDEYGWEQVYRLFETPPDPTPGPEETPAPPTRYAQTLGRPLAELEAAWLARVRRSIAAR